MVLGYSVYALGLWVHGLGRVTPQESRSVSSLKLYRLEREGDAAFGRLRVQLRARARGLGVRV